ncbi:DgyrCDS14292 [Dimorphilus gyrociliatus]|uniref:DgyrCDS14292 n=1 Tax=Dimorphilus gyrociliatus TaxID=2664684 RepID=A0A7I8WD75_9ANNE|nr:DgyrCDS14292 [Dimorphilus gyrociliatus]
MSALPAATKYLEMSTVKDSAIRTIVLYLCYFATGIHVIILPCSLVEIGKYTSSTISEVTLLVTLRAVGDILGGFIAVPLLEYVNPYFYMTITGLVAAIFQSIGIWFKDITIMGLFMGIGSLGHSTLIIGSNAEVLREWDTKSAGWIQGLHGSFAVGALVAPLMIQPFLTTSKLAKHVVIQKAFLIDGAILLCVCVFLFTVWLYYYRTIKYVSAHQSSLKEMFFNVIKAIGFNRKFSFMVVVILYFILEVGMEATSISLLSHYCVHYLAWSEHKAALLVFVLTLFYSVARFFNAGITRCLKTTILLVGSFLISIFSMFLLSFSYKHESIVWISVALMGVGRAALYPGCVVFVDHFLPVRQSLGIVFHLSASIGSLILPQIAARIVQSYGYQWYGVALLVITSLMFISFNILILISKNMKPQNYVSDDLNEKIIMSEEKSSKNETDEASIHSSINDTNIPSYSK